MTEAQRRRWFLRTVIGMAIAVAVVVGGPWVYASFFVREPPEPLALTPTPVATPEVPTGPVDIEGTWYVQADSEAGYRLGETLSGEQVTVVGRTDQVTGTVVITDETLTATTVTVDVGSISSEEAARDAFFRRALDTTTHPTATFELTSPVDVSALAASGEPQSVTAAGTLTMHGVAVPVTATLQVQRTVSGVELAGQVPVALADFGLTPPDLGWVVVEPTGTVEVLVVLARDVPPGSTSG